MTMRKNLRNQKNASAEILYLFYIEIHLSFKDVLIILVHGKMFQFQIEDVSVLPEHAQLAVF